MAHISDKTGQVFGRLTVKEYAGKNYHHESMWLCECICGNTKVVLTGQLMAGNVKSCGCLQKERNLIRRKTHGKTNTRLFHIWQGMKQRCFDVNSTDYRNYGGRGITVCEEWASDFQSFYNWAMSNGYTDSLTIDRINNNLNYSPENCRWATYKMQANNKRNNVLLEFKGKIHTLTEWVSITGIKESTIRERLKRGWTTEKALGN